MTKQDIQNYIDTAIWHAEFTEEDGLWFAEVKSMPGVLAFGDTLNACREQLKDVVEGWVTLRQQRNLPIFINTQTGINTDNLPILEELDRGEAVDKAQTERFLSMLRNTPRGEDRSEKVIIDGYLKSFNVTPKKT
jgi:predicted RNase H-like HicB family nuclease